MSRDKSVNDVPRHHIDFTDECHAQFLADEFRQIGHDERAGYGLALAYGCSLLNGPARVHG